MKYRSCKYFTAMEGGLRRKTIGWLGPAYSEGMCSLCKGGTAQGCCQTGHTTAKHTQDPQDLCHQGLSTKNSNLSRGSVADALQ